MQLPSQMNTEHTHKRHRNTHWSACANRLEARYYLHVDKQHWPWAASSGGVLIYLPYVKPWWAVNNYNIASFPGHPTVQLQKWSRRGYIIPCSFCPKHWSFKRLWSKNAYIYHSWFKTKNACVKWAPSTKNPFPPSAYLSHEWCQCLFWSLLGYIFAHCKRIKNWTVERPGNEANYDVYHITSLSKYFIGWTFSTHVAYLSISLQWTTHAPKVDSTIIESKQWSKGMQCMPVSAPRTCRLNSSSSSVTRCAFSWSSLALPFHRTLQLALNSWSFKMLNVLPSSQRCLSSTAIMVLRLSSS